MTPPAKRAPGAHSRAKTPTQSPGKKRAPQKRSPRKRKSGKALPGLVFAFAAGLVLASLLFWLLRGLSLPGLQDISQLKAPPAAEAPQTQPARHSPSGTKKVLPRIPQSNEQAVPQRKEAGRDSAVESALMDLQSMAYEEIPERDSLPEEPEALRPGAALPDLRAGSETPKLVIVIDDLGASETALRQLLALDYPVSCAFWPHGGHTRSGADAAYAAGREILVHQPMEPLGYPKVRPGPNALLFGMNGGRIRQIVKDSIACVPHATGLNNHMGSRFTQQADGVEALLRTLKEHNLFMLDSMTHKNSLFAARGAGLGIERYSRDVFLDAVHSKAAILAELRRAERIALLTGRAVAIGHPLPETLNALRDWQKLRNRSVRIVRLRDLGQGQ